MGRYEQGLIHDWNQQARARPLPASLSFYDETLRDGLQNPSVVDPAVERKIELLHLMNSLGVHVVNVGLPGASQRSREHALAMCKEIARARLPIRPSAAGRTVVADVNPIVEISQRVGLPIDVYVFIGSSPIRQLAEDWNLASISVRLAAALDAAVLGGLRASFVPEDATRTRPDVLARLFQVAVDHGASRVCLADTVGHATPDGVESIVRFTRRTLDEMGAREVGLDWHGHNDRGLALANALRAAQVGADRLHATALGIGERVGNTPMELLLVNLRLEGHLQDQDLSSLPRYCELAARIVGWDIPVNYPVVGRDAFRTATGVHASAIIKALRIGQDELADCVYSSVPAGMFGRSQQIEVGYMSGGSNVTHWLRRHGIEPTPSLVDAVLRAAKTSDHILSEAEIREAVDAWRARS